ncbi:MAG: hypothetical protein AAFN10_03990 [Bacteroidota bacterium]
MKHLLFWSLSIVLILGSSNQSFAQSPMLAGKVTLSIAKGSMQCEWLLTDYPAIENYRLLLHAGFNLDYLHNGATAYAFSTEREYDMDVSYEAFQYYIPNSSNDGSFLPDSLRIRYTGAFPVQADTNQAPRMGDWKGNIVFNGKTARMTEQALWYPVLYDAATNKMLQEVRYDIEVVCEDCKALYLNGSAAVKGQRARFQTDNAYPLLLFAGDFEFVQSEQLSFVNTQLSVPQRETLTRWTTETIDFYEQLLDHPYGERLSYLSGRPYTRKNAWMFVTYPTIAVMGWDDWQLAQFIDVENGGLTSFNNVAFLSHEIGHYYFGSLIKPRGVLRWAFLEGITEYLSLQYVRASFGEEAYQKRIAGYVNWTQKNALVPLSEIETYDQISSPYRYAYFPMILTVMEKELGREAIIDWLQYLLALEEVPSCDYTFFRASLLASGLEESRFAELEVKYLKGEGAFEAVLKGL